MRWFWRWLSKRLLLSVVSEIDNDSDVLLVMPGHNTEEDAQYIADFMDSLDRKGDYLIVMSDDFSLVRFK